MTKQKTLKALSNFNPIENKDWENYGIFIPLSIKDEEIVTWKIKNITCDIKSEEKETSSFRIIVCEKKPASKKDWLYRSFINLCGDETKRNYPFDKIKIEMGNYIYIDFFSIARSATDWTVKIHLESFNKYIVNTALCAVNSVIICRDI